LASIENVSPLDRAASNSAHTLTIKATIGFSPCQLFIVWVEECHADLVTMAVIRVTDLVPSKRSFKSKLPLTRFLKDMLGDLSIGCGSLPRVPGKRNAMIRKYLTSHEHPLQSADLDICQRAFDALLIELDIAKDTEEAERVAAVIIELYQQGVHDEHQLLVLAGGARGKI
jgi:hypothetical protein